MPCFKRLFIALCFTALPALAQRPLAVGDSIPADFKALDSLQREATFASLKGEKGLVLLFTRSADWCQYCKTQLRDWNAKADALKSAGYGLAAISYDAPTTLAKFEADNKLSYMLLSDGNSAAIKRFGIRNEKFDEGSRFYGIPNPAIYVFDTAGKIAHVYREESYKDRPSIESILADIMADDAPKADATPAQ
jgi:peroxiredoxin